MKRCFLLLALIPSLLLSACGTAGEEQAAERVHAVSVESDGASADRNEGSGDTDGTAPSEGSADTDSTAPSEGPADTDSTAPSEGSADMDGTDREKGVVGTDSTTDGEGEPMPDGEDSRTELPVYQISGEAVPVGTLARDGGTGEDVWLPENGRFVPFLVLADRYSGGVLLLRREVLPDSRPWNDYTAFYPDSAVDRFLNGEYAERLNRIRELLRPSEITVTEEASLGTGGTGTASVERTVFLLSCAEIGLTDLSNGGGEGTPLAWFRAPEHRIAYREDGTAASWWLRSPDTYYLSAVYSLGPDGSLGSGNAYNENGVRPAFCVALEAKACPAEGIAEGQSVYVLLPDAET